MPSTSSPDRRTALTDAAIRVLGHSGGRGLTHRAVDHELGLAAGSTGNYFSTRAALLVACAQRLAERDLADAAALPSEPGPALSASDVAELLSAYLISRLEPEPRIRQLARLELLLEASRSPTLDSEFTALRERFIAAVAQLLSTAGSRSPQDAAREVVSTFDGLLFDQLLYRRTAVEPRHISGHFASVISPLLTAT